MGNFAIPSGVSPDLTSQTGLTERYMPHAREFESMLLSQWLQGAESSFATVPGADKDEDAGDEQFRNFAVQQLAKSITAAGGVGLAPLVAKALAHSASAKTEELKAQR